MAWVISSEGNGALFIQSLLGLLDLNEIPRFCNVDPLVAISMGGDNSSLDLVLSYDIVCIWGVHFPDRLTQLPLQWRVNFDPNRVRFCVPKFHLWAHRVCQICRYISDRY